MRITSYLIVSASGRMRVTKNRPALDADEISIMLNLTIPQRFFDRPLPVVSIELPEGAIADLKGTATLSITAKTVAESLGLEVQAVEDGLSRLVDEGEDVS